MKSLFLWVISRVRYLWSCWRLGAVGKGTYFDTHITYRYPGNIFIGDDVSVGTGVWLGASSQGAITVGNRTAIAAGARFVTPTHDYHILPIRSIGINQPIVVGEDVWIGTAAIILPGVTIHDGAVVAAGAVVTRDVPCDCVVAGVPAKVIKQLEPRETRLQRGLTK